MAEFVSGPKTYTFPLWRGQDSVFTVNRRDPDTGQYIDYDDGTTAKVVFTSGTTEYTFEAEIVGHTAQFIVDDQSVADVRNGSMWRLQFTVDGIDRALVVGKVVRKDVR